VIDGVEDHIRPGDSFVDDTPTGTTNDDSELEDGLAQEAQQNPKLGQTHWMDPLVVTWK
jgi:hypothetical protein